MRVWGAGGKGLYSSLDHPTRQQVGVRGPRNWNDGEVVALECYDTEKGRSASACTGGVNDLEI